MNKRRLIFLQKKINYDFRKSLGRVILAVNSVFWCIKLLDFLNVHSQFGPFITMAAKMVSLY